MLPLVGRTNPQGFGCSPARGISRSSDAALRLDEAQGRLQKALGLLSYRHWRHATAVVTTKPTREIAGVSMPA